MEPIQPQTIETENTQNQAANLNSDQTQPSIKQNKVEKVEKVKKVKKVKKDSSQIQQKSKKLPNANHMNEKKITQNEYLQSIDQIERISQHPKFKENQFLKFILRDFSPFVFKQELSPKLQKTQKPHEMFIQSEQSHHDSKGQNMQNQNEDKQQQLILNEEFFNIQKINQLLQHKQVSIMIETNVIFHCRIVFFLYLLTSLKVSNKQTYNFTLSLNLINLKQKLTSNSFRYSFDQNIWTIHQSQNQSPRKNTQSQQNLTQNENFAAIKNDQTFIMIDTFYKKLGFGDQDHLFNRKMKIITQTSYRLKYINQFAFYSFKSKQQVLDFLDNNQSDRFNNILFYSNEFSVTYNKLTLNLIHQLKNRDYGWLQRSHDYIQWLFPNHFQSYFNENSFALGYVEAEIFKIDSQIQQRLITSFEIYLDFMGCQIKKIKIPQTHRSEILIIFIQQKSQIERLKDCLIRNTHNHLRIMRILACLSVTGLRNYAQSFLRFLNGLKNSTIIDFNWIKYPLEMKWNLYSSLSEQKKQKALKMCFIPYQDFPQSEQIEIEQKI